MRSCHAKGLHPLAADHPLRVPALSRSCYLVLPEDFRNVDVPLEQIGAFASGRFRLVDLSGVYVLNKARAPYSSNRIKFGLLCMYAVQHGWYQGQSTVRYERRPEDAVEIMSKDLIGLVDERAAALQASFLVPFFYEIAVVWSGVSSSREHCLSLYRGLASMCMAPLMHRYLSSYEVSEMAFCWIGPDLARTVLAVFCDYNKLVHHPQRDVLRRLILLHEFRLQSPLCTPEQKSIIAASPFHVDHIYVANRKEYLAQFKAPVQTLAQEQQHPSLSSHEA